MASHNGQQSDTTHLNDMTRLIRAFDITEVLNEDPRGKSICLLGRIQPTGHTDPEIIPGVNAAILTLERLAFSRQAFDPRCGDSNPAAPRPFATAHLVSCEHNDIYSWAQGTMAASDVGTAGGMEDVAALSDTRFSLIYPCKEKHIEKHRHQAKHIIHETPALYHTVVKPYIYGEPQSRIQWVYNILDHKHESERIIFEEPNKQDGFVLLPDFKWDGKTIDSLYLVVIVHRHDLKSLRDLGSEHLGLLKSIRDKVTDAVTERYLGVGRDQLRFYIHYQPSYYHLHIHVTHVHFEAPGMFIGRAHLVDMVIDNIENIAGDYYQSRATLSYVLGENDALYRSIHDAVCRY